MRREKGHGLGALRGGATGGQGGRGCDGGDTACRAIYLARLKINHQ